MNFIEALTKYNGGILRGAQTRLAKAIKVKPNTVSQWASVDDPLRPGEEVARRIAAEFSKTFPITAEEILAMYPGKSAVPLVVADSSDVVMLSGRVPFELKSRFEAARKRHGWNAQVALERVVTQWVDEDEAKHGSGVKPAWEGPGTTKGLEKPPKRTRETLDRSGQ